MSKVILIIIFIVFLILFNRFYIDSIVENVYSRINPSIRFASNLKGDKMERIIFKAIPRKYTFSQKKLSKNAFILIHGYNTFPKSMEKLMIGLKTFRYDIYCPLMKYHGYTIRETKKFNNKEISERLAEDIDYVCSLGYEKIFCIGYSYSGLQLVNLSSEDLLKKNIYLILINPAIRFKNDGYFFMFLLFISMPYSSYIFKNYNLFSAYSFGMKNVDEYKNTFYEHCEYLYVKISGIRIIILSKRVAGGMKKLSDYVRNKFTVIFSLDDRLLSCSESKELFSSQKRFKAFFEINGGHSVLFDDNHIGNIINKIKKSMASFE